MKHATSVRVADALDAAPEQSAPVFVIVSARALLDANGLLNQLKERGFQVRDLQR